MEKHAALGEIDRRILQEHSEFAKEYANGKWSCMRSGRKSGTHRSRRSRRSLPYHGYPMSRYASCSHPFSVSAPMPWTGHSEEPACSIPIPVLLHSGR